MFKLKNIFSLNIFNCALLTVICALICGCAAYQTPPRADWPIYLRGASMIDMTPTAMIAKRPVYLGAGGKIINRAQSAEHNYTDPESGIREYMSDLEYALYDGLRKPGISVQCAGTDVVVILVRDALMQMDAGQLSDDGIDTLNIITKILQKYDATWIEIAGYTDAMRDQAAAKSLSTDMAMRVGLYMSQNKINTARMFISGRGSSRPIADQTDVGRLTNRRVELRIAPAR